MKQDVIVFGHGRYYRSKQENLKKNYNVIGFIDNALKPGESGEDEQEKVKIYNPKEIGRFSPKAQVIVMSVKYFDMWKQLLELGVEEDRIRFGIMLSPAYSELEAYYESIGCEIFSRDKVLHFRQADGTENVFQDEEEYRIWLRKKQSGNIHVKNISELPLVPISRRFGQERGTAIDRIYIEKFIEEHKNCIRGDVMEIADLRYTQKYEKECNIRKAYMLHVNGWGENVIKGNLETGEGIEENMVDCLIFTQTLQFIYNVHDVIKNIHRMLKPGGTVLITASVVGQISLYDYHKWGEYWRITDQAIKKLLCNYFKEEQVEVRSYGNVKTAIAFLYGLCAEDLQSSDFAYDDEQFPMIVVASARKE